MQFDNVNGYGVAWGGSVGWLRGLQPTGNPDGAMIIP